MSAKQIRLLSIPQPGPLAMNARLPIPQLLAMTLAAEPIRLIKRHGCATGKPQHVTIQSIMAVQAPAVLLIVPQDNVFVGHEFARLGIRLVVIMTFRARKNVLGERRRRDLDVLVCCNIRRWRAAFVFRAIAGRRCQKDEGQRRQNAIELCGHHGKVLT